MAKADVLVSDHGSVVTVAPLTGDARTWVAQNVELEAWAWMGGAFAVEPRYLDNLIDGMVGDGLTVEAA